MQIPDYYTSRFEELDEQRRRIDDEFNIMVQRMRSGDVRDDERLRMEAQHLHVRHQGIIREMIERPAVHYPDALSENPHPLVFTPVDEKLVLEDRTHRLEIYRVIEHSHMPNAVFAYLPRERITLEGDLGECVAKDKHVVKRDRSDNCDPGLDYISRVQPPAEADRKSVV